jgi:hypothetical protein
MHATLEKLKTKPKAVKSANKAFAHQVVSLAHSAANKLVFDASDPGCVSADTEFLTPTGWKRIDQYTIGDEVAQFYPDLKEIEFVVPLAYVKKPCTEMINIAPSRGTSQRLSAEHRVLYYNPNGSHGVCAAAEFMATLHQQGASHSKRKFCVTFSVKGSQSINLSDAQLRLMVAVIADGSFSCKTARCVVRLKKDRKVERMRKLLAQSSTDYKIRICGGNPDFLVFTFNAPRREKEFSEFWWGASQRQLEVIADELPHWDSAVSSRPSKSIRFSSFSAASAEFAQYAFSAAKQPASMNCTYRDRTSEGRGVMVEHIVCARANDTLIGPGRSESVYLAPNPEGFKYCFEVPTSFLLFRHGGYIFATGNTGKTYVRIMSFLERRKQHKKAALVLAPRSLLNSTWAKDIRTFAPGLRVSVATATNRAAAFAVDADVYVTNADAAKWLGEQPKSFFNKFAELIIDESTVFKHHTSQRSKAVGKISKFFEYRTCMTGTPNSNSITDVWHQIKLLDGGERLGSSFFGFRNSVCDAVQVGRSAHALKWTDKDGAEEAVFGLINDMVIRHKFEDCVDIPANHQYTLPYNLTAKQQAAYDELQETQMMTFRAAKQVSSITAVNAAVVATKLLQVASGAVYSAPGVYQVVDTGRYEMILDLIEQRKHSLCFFLWKHQRDLLIKEAEKRGITFCVFDGSVSDKEREQMVTDYQAGAFQVMFAHPKSAAHGLTLTTGTATIWSSPTYDLEIFKQGSKRQHRMGQTQKTETIVVVADNTIEQKVYDAMLSKDARMTSLLELFSTI